jgi:hypothetical protein
LFEQNLENSGDIPIDMERDGKDSNVETQLLKTRISHMDPAGSFFNVHGDGDCMYRALFDQLTHGQIHDAKSYYCNHSIGTYTQLKQTLCDWLRTPEAYDNMKEFQENVRMAEYVATDDEKAGSGLHEQRIKQIYEKQSKQTWEKRVDRYAAKPGVDSQHIWGDALMLVAAANALGMGIYGGK